MEEGLPEGWTMLAVVGVQAGGRGLGQSRKGLQTPPQWSEPP